MTTIIDFFCGAGGSSTGLHAAGFEVVAAANHWKLAIETHNTNHPDTEHFLDDLQQAHPSLFPRTDVAWFSPECTNHSLAKGKRRKGANQRDLWGDTGLTEAEIKSRATMREVVEFTAWHHYQAVIVENVVDIRYWEYFDQWLLDMHNLGYQSKLLYLNAQFFGVPQSRDRFYAVFWRKGNRAPQLDFRPSAACPRHGVVKAVQVFKKPDYPWGRYGERRQYQYRCPHCGTSVKPEHIPAATVIDWSLTAPRIGDRDKPLKPRTLERIRAGLKKFGRVAHVADLGHMHAEHPGKVTSVDAVLPTQSTQQTLSLVEPFLTAQHDGRNPLRSLTDPLWAVTGMNNEQQLVVPPFLAVMKNSSADGYNQPSLSLADPLSTIVATASQHALVQPFIAELRKGNESHGVDEPLSTLTAGGGHHALVMSYYGESPTFAPVSQPLPTLRTVEHEALIEVTDDLVDSCGFRMLEPHELKRGMSFPDQYVILGNKKDQVRQIGNAVCCHVAQWIGQQVLASLA